MISVKPLSVPRPLLCPYCSHALPNQKVIWQGIRVCIRSVCSTCGAEIFSDLAIGHAIYYPFQVDIRNKKIFGPARGSDWLGEPLLYSLGHPSSEKIHIRKYINVPSNLKEIIIVNCLDFMYGHCILKLFNVQQYKRILHTKKIIVLVPECIRWLVPVYVHEIWSVTVPLNKTQQYNLYLEQFINNELKHYKAVYLSETNCHPKHIQIYDFSKVRPNITNIHKTITYFWRHDRLWISDQFINKPRLNVVFKELLFTIEQYKILSLFFLLKQRLPDYTFMIVGIGKEKRFPAWICDVRIPIYNQQQEQRMCSYYSKSTLVIGTLGSHIILPAAHAFMTLELSHPIRTECFGQDMIIPSHISKLDPRLYFFRHRIIPSASSIRAVANTVVSMVNDYQYSKMYFRNRST